MEDIANRTDPYNLNSAQDSGARPSRQAGQAARLIFPTSDREYPFLLNFTRSPFHTASTSLPFDFSQLLYSTRYYQCSFVIGGST
jgi:hypothetical protein